MDAATDAIGARVDSLRESAAPAGIFDAFDDVFQASAGAASSACSMPKSL